MGPLDTPTTVPLKKLDSNFLNKNGYTASGNSLRWVTRLPVNVRCSCYTLYRTNGVVILSTTAQLPATHRKVEGGERDIQLVRVNEANSCLARGYCVYCKLAQGERCLSNPPPSPLPLPQPSPPPPWLNSCSFQCPRPKARMASI
jgi:hypothetical protein